MADISPAPIETMVEEPALTAEPIMSDDITPKAAQTNETLAKDADLEQSQDDIAAALASSLSIDEADITVHSSDTTEDLAEELAVSDKVETPDIIEVPTQVEEVAEEDAVFSPKSRIADHNDDSIAAKLRRIRAVVSKVEAEDSSDNFSEDEHAETLHADAAEPDENDDMPAANTPAQPLRARVIRMKRADFDEAVASGLLEAEPVDDDEEDDYEDSETFDASAPKTDANPNSDPESSNLSADDEAELMAELAEVEAEMHAGETTTSEAPDAEEESSVSNDRGQTLTQTSPEESADLSRILKETNDHLEEPEGNRRRRSIAHLRAAVAATEAEKKLSGGNNEKPDTSERYRDDLASVVLPKEAPNDSPRARRRARQEKAAPAPLKLVAEQRIDTDEPKESAPRGPVRPRRVSAVDRSEQSNDDARSAAPVSAEPTDAASFADFAETMGATKLPDLLEAAASYLSYVEGRDQFSRPMLMRLARQTTGDEFNREDGLRSFGQLLRQNKIEKISGGRFTVSDQISFKPQDRAAG
jgi:hypothetical protein